MNDTLYDCAQNAKKQNQSWSREDWLGKSRMRATNIVDDSNVSE